MAECERERGELETLRAQLDAYYAIVGGSNAKLENVEEPAEQASDHPAAAIPPVWPSPLIEAEISGRHLPDGDPLQRMAAGRQCRVEVRNGLFCVRAWDRLPEYVAGIYLKGLRSDAEDELAISQLKEMGWSLFVEDASQALQYFQQGDEFLQSWDWPIGSWHFH